MARTRRKREKGPRLLPCILCLLMVLSVSVVAEAAPAVLGTPVNSTIALLADEDAAYYFDAATAAQETLTVADQQQY